MAPSIAILSVSLDLHALAVRKELEDRHAVSCFIVETDKVAGSGGVSWSNVEGFGAAVPNDKGATVSVDSLDAIWWRRVNTPPVVPSSVTDSAHRTLVTNDCQASILGVLLNEFTGTWVSHPVATREAENKLVQLRIAEACGLRTPQTLVSQDPDVIRRFCSLLDNRVVVKPVRGTHVQSPLTAPLDERLLGLDDSMALVPAIYQEYIDGTRHLRVHVFGDRVYAAALETDAVDWRTNLNTPVEPTELPASLVERLRDVIQRLGLVMGVVDLKVGVDGEPVWLEVNPQGQFLFIEGLTGLPLTSAMAEYLAAEARDAARRRIPASEAIPSAQL